MTKAVSGRLGCATAGVLILLVALLGCAADGGRAKPATAPQAAAGSEISRGGGVETLQALLAGLDAEVDNIEARRVAETAITYSRTLAEKYQVVRPAVWHNILVRMGIRERGLCYQWTTDLMRRLQGLELTSLELHWGVAHRGSELREHNSVVIAARGQPFERGIVLDPWRHGGDLFWVAVTQDRYPWMPLPQNQWF